MEETKVSKGYVKDVDPTRIRFNDRPLNLDNFFRNARTTLKKEEMTSLRTSIQQVGLLQNIVVRPITGDKDHDYELVAGARRLRSITHLIEHNLDCKDPSDGSVKKASQLYRTMPVQIRVCDDVEANCISIGENLEHAQLPDMDLMDYCTEMAALRSTVGEAVFSREQIANMCNRSESWVSLTLKLADLPPEVKELMRQGRLTRTAALSFLQTAPEKLRQVICKAKELTKQDAVKEETVATEELDDAEESLEDAEVDMTYSAAIQDTSTASQAQKRFIQAQKRVSAASEKRASARKKIEEGAITADKINEANMRIPGAKKGAPKPLPMKTVRQLYDEYSSKPPTSAAEKLVHKGVCGVLELVLGHRFAEGVAQVIEEERGKIDGEKEEGEDWDMDDDDDLD